MTVKECIDIVDNMKPNQYSVDDKVRWLSFLDMIVVNDVLKTHEDFDRRYEDFEGYSADKLAMKLIADAPYDQMYVEFLKMKIDEENGETARYNNTATMFNSYFSIFKKWYNKTHMPLQIGKHYPKPMRKHGHRPAHRPEPPQDEEQETDETM